MPEQPRLKITEDALEELRIAHARHGVRPTDLGRHRPARYRIGGGVGTPTESAECWLRMISIVEIYTEALLKLLDGDQANPAPKGWGDVISSLQRRHSIDATSVAGWDQLAACILVRNALAHGLGRFTAYQLTKDAPRKVRAIGVPVRDGMVVITAASLARCAETCSSFIATLDMHPQVATRT